MQYVDAWPVIKEAAGTSTAVLCAIVLLGLVVYGVRNIVPILNKNNSLIREHTQVTKACCESINAQTSLLQEMKTSFAVHDQRTNQLQTEVSGIGQKVDRLEQNVSQISNRIETVASTVGVIQGKVGC